jgi:hypothetical protein
MSHPFLADNRTWPAAVFDSGPQRAAHWHMARAAHVDLLLMGMPRTNLLLIAPDDVVHYVLQSLMPDLWEPVTRWSAGDALTLPPAASGGTLVLHDVHALTIRDQRRLLEWMERTKGRNQVVSTTSSPLLARVNQGEFIATLFYRLNTVCVDVTRLEELPS